MTLWAIEVTPLNGRSKPWIHHGTVARRRKEAWEMLRGGGTPLWHKTIKSRQRKGLLRAVKVTIELAKDTK